MTASGLKRRILTCTETVACRLASQVLCISHSLADEAKRLEFAPRTKSSCWAPAATASTRGRSSIRGDWQPMPVGGSGHRAAFPTYGVVLGFVGRIVRDKGMTELAVAWPALRARFPTLHLLLAGPFEPQDPVPEEVGTLFLGDPAIHLTGQVRDLPPYYAAMDVCVLPTYREGFPNVAVEAAAMELPMVATRITGCVDAVVDGETGLLVPPRDANALADAIATYLASTELRRQHGRAGMCPACNGNFAAKPSGIRCITNMNACFGRKESSHQRTAANGMTCGKPPGGIVSSFTSASNLGSRNSHVKHRSAELISKRTLDVCAAAVLLLLLWPLMAIIWLLVGWAMGPGAIFRQQCAGIGGTSSSSTSSAR